MHPAFAFVKQLGKNPELVGNELGSAMQKDLPDIITNFNIVKGFLNFTISPLAITTTASK